MSEQPVCPCVILCWGNPSRGDDALGPMMAEWLESRPDLPCDVIVDFQLQIEHALDLQNRQRVWFVDAAVNLDKPFTIKSVSAEKDHSFTSHALSPNALLQVFENTFLQTAPQASLISISGYQFELGTGLTAQAENNLAEAEKTLLDLLYK